MFNAIYLIFSFYLRVDKATWSSILFSSEKSKTQLSTNDCQDMGTKICYIVPESGESDIGTYFYIFLDCILISKFIKWHRYMYLIYQVGIKCHENTYRGCFFNWSTRSSVPIWKTNCSQPGLVFHEIFNLKKAPCWLSKFFFFILVLKIGRTS